MIENGSWTLHNLVRCIIVGQCQTNTNGFACITPHWRCLQYSWLLSNMEKRLNKLLVYCQWLRNHTYPRLSKSPYSWMFDRCWKTVEKCIVMTPYTGVQTQHCFRWWHNWGFRIANLPTVSSRCFSSTRSFPPPPSIFLGRGWRSQQGERWRAKLDGHYMVTYHGCH